MKNSRFVVVAAVTWLILFLSSPARSAEFPYPKVDYSADMRMDMGKDPYGKRMIMTGRLYFSPKKVRREMTGLGNKTIIIQRRDKGVNWHLMPSEKMYMESHSDPKKNDPERMMREGNVKFTKLGSERVNGMRTTKYKFEVVHKDGGRFDGYHWMTKDNIPVRMMSTSKGQQFQIDYTNIKIGKQNPRLFEIPAGYRRMTMPQVPGWPSTGMGSGATRPGGSAPGGMSKEQVEQMRKQMEEMMKRMKKR